MRVLKFEGNTKEYYNVIYEGLAASNTKGQDTRILGKVFIKLEEWGEPVQGTPLYRLNADSATISLEDAEYDLVKRLLDLVEWNGLGARKAGLVLDWLDNIKQETLKKV